MGSMGGGSRVDCLSAGCNSYSATPTADAQAVVACRIFCALAQLYAEMKLIQWCPPGRTRPSLDASTHAHLPAPPFLSDLAIWVCWHFI